MSDASTPPTPDDLLHRVRRLETEIDREHRPWFRRPSNFISVIALVASLGVSAYTVYKDFIAATERKAQELAKITQQLTEVDEMQLRVYLTGLNTGDPASSQEYFRTQARLQITFNNRRAVLLDKAEVLRQELGKRVSAVELAIIGVGHQQQQDYQKAISYYETLTDPKESEYYQVSAWRSLAGIFFLLGDDTWERGRESFQRAIDIMEAQSTATSLPWQAALHEEWALFEIQGEQYDLAFDQLVMARDKFRQLACLIPTRQGVLARIEQRLIQISQHVPSLFEPFQAAQAQTDDKCRR